MSGKIENCCTHSSKSKSCMRMKDNKIFTLPRKYKKDRCIKGPVKGFTMRASCAPYSKCNKKGGKKKKFKTRKKMNKKNSKTKRRLQNYKKRK